MLHDPEEVTQAEIEDMARRRVWARVQIGMAADRRRRRRRATLATLAGGVMTTVLMLLLIL